MARIARKNREHRATTTIEMAILLPILLLLTFAMIEYGWLFLKVNQTTNAARHAARVAAITEEVEGGEANYAAANAVAQLMSTAGIDDYTLAISRSEVASKDTITVEITVPYENLRLTGMPMPLPDNLKASMSMAKESD